MKNVERITPIVKLNLKILCDYSDVYILLSGTITVVVLVAGGRNNNIQVFFKNCAPFTNFLSEINNTQIDNARYIDVVMQCII